MRVGLRARCSELPGERVVGDCAHQTHLGDDLAYARSHIQSCASWLTGVIVCITPSSFPDLRISVRHPLCQVHRAVAARTPPRIWLPCAACWPSRAPPQLAL